MFRKLHQVKAKLVNNEKAQGRKNIAARRRFNRLLAGAKRKQKQKTSTPTPRRGKRRKRKKMVDKEFGLNVGDVIVMQGDPKHSSEKIKGNRIVALYFYHRKDGTKDTTPKVQHFPGLINESDARIHMENVVKYFDVDLSTEDFGAKRWNNITNYTKARDDRKKINENLKPVMKELQKQINKALKKQGVRMRDYNLVENFVNYYQPGKSSTHGIGQHQDRTDMSVVVQLLNTGKFHATVEE